MASLYKKVISGKPYWYLREMGWVDGPPKMISERYLGSTAASRASSSASMSAAVPRYRSEIIFGRPSTQPISRRYQYGFPLITFLYRLAISLGHRIFRGKRQGDTPDCRRPGLTGDVRQLIKIEIARKLGLVSCHTTFALSGSAWETRQCGYRHLSQSLVSGVAPVAAGRVGEPWRHLVAVDTSR